MSEHTFELDNRTLTGSVKEACWTEKDENERRRMRKEEGERGWSRKKMGQEGRWDCKDGGIGRAIMCHILFLSDPPAQINSGLCW